MDEDEKIKIMIMKIFHDDFIGGHRGIQSTFYRINERFWWPKMFQEIETYVKVCESCQTFSKKTFREPMSATVSSGALDKVHIDVVHMPTGKGGFRCFIDARDDLSGLIEAKSLKNTESASILKFIKDYINRFGYPSRFVSGRGELDDLKIKSYLQDRGIELVLTTTYHPPGNGTVEQDVVGVRSTLGERGIILVG